MDVEKARKKVLHGRGAGANQKVAKESWRVSHREVCKELRGMNGCRGVKNKIKTISLFVI